MKAEGSDPSGETYLELKYCERCGGLWLRERGSGQMYCVACGQALAEMPASTRRLSRAQVPRGPKKWGDEDFEAGIEAMGMDLEAMGGVA